MNRKLPLILMKTASILEAAVAALIIVVILVGGGLLIADTVITLRGAPQALNMNHFLSEALELIVGIEFVKMLLKHTPGAVIEVLLFAIAREMVVTHTGALDTLFGVIAVAVIFYVRRYLYRADPTSEETIDH